MFENLSNKLASSFKRLTGASKLSESNIEEVVSDVRVALLEADVALEVVEDFLSSVTRRALGFSVAEALDVHQTFVKIVHEELTKMMGESQTELSLKAKPPVIVLMAGLQGSGKTTSAAKLGKHIKEKYKKRVAVASGDIYRPAAIEQLRILSDQAGLDFIESNIEQTPRQIAEDALKEAKGRLMDVLLFDTAGRQSVDDEMMSEITDLSSVLSPTETLFVVDAMMGQDAAASAKAFDEALDLTGVILTKTDGDARGGAALSVKAITGKPIKFLGVGEKIDALDAFHPDRMASRILGMGDILTLIEEAETKVDKEKAQKLAAKVQKRQKFDLEDFRDQIEQMKNMGGLEGILDKLPGAANLPGTMNSSIEAKKFERMGIILDSMSKRERQFPDLINPSRKKRIAAGSGSQVGEVNGLLKQYKQMQKMMKKVGRKGGMQRIARSMQNMGGGMFDGIPRGR